ncbi:MAG: GNAT family N-acetyltransferase [Geminicoccaceae bacterium]
MSGDERGSTLDDFLLEEGILDVPSEQAIKSVLAWQDEHAMKAKTELQGPSFSIRPARSAADMAVAAKLFEAYAASLPVDLAYQDFATELATLPGKYAPPTGELLLAFSSDGTPLGCVALRPLPPDGCCEMKRLYVDPSARGLGLGRALVDAVIEAARQLGYREMRLDSLPSMTEAMALYRKAGFAPIAPYYATPIAGTTFLGLALDA